jgi:hypothetical protein
MTTDDEGHEKLGFKLDKISYGRIKRHSTPNTGEIYYYSIVFGAGAIKITVGAVGSLVREIEVYPIPPSAHDDLFGLRGHYITTRIMGDFQKTIYIYIYIYIYMLPSN